MAKPAKGRGRAVRNARSMDAAPWVDDGRSLSAAEEALLRRRLAEGEALRVQTLSKRRARLREAGLDWLVTFVAIYLALQPHLGGTPLIGVSAFASYVAAVVAAFGVYVSLLASREAIYAAGVVVAAKPYIERVNAAAKRHGVRLDDGSSGE